MKLTGLFRWLMLGMALFAAVVWTSRSVADRSIRARIERTLDVSFTDAYDTLIDAVNVSLSILVHSVGDAIGTCSSFDRDRLRMLCKVCGVDEINIGDTNGVWIASSENGVAGKRIDRTVETTALLNAFDPTHPTIVQDFRQSSDPPYARRKYAAVAFDDGSGLVEIGFDERRIAQDFDSNFPGLFRNWNIDDNRYFIIAHKNGTIVSIGRKSLEGNLTLASLGLDLKRLPKSPNKTFVATLDGERCYCRIAEFFERLLVIVIPERSYTDMRRTMVAMPIAFLLAFVMCAAWRLRLTRKRRLALLAQQRAEEERHAEDMTMARDIQHASLPTVFPPYPRDLAIDLFAEMRPARDVGGDFYDFYYAGAEHLAVLIADVSGKGIPAAMMMMKAKTVIREQMMSVNDLGEALAAANEKLCEGNPLEMFVTCWLGVLNERTGELRYVNAGHNPPVIRASDGQMKVLDEVSGMPLGAMTGLKYGVKRAQLTPGDLLFLYTDGVTEANDTSGAMFGDNRLSDALHGLDDSGDPVAVCRRVNERLAAFVGNAAAFDDITMLALVYRGMPTVEMREFAAELDSVPLMNAFAERYLDDTACPPEVKCDLLVCLDEIANNSASYSGAKRMWLRVEAARGAPIWRFTVIDDGSAWNPLDHLDPDITLSADDRPIGGLGIMMVKKLTDDVSYVRADGRNQFRFRKQTPQATTGSSRTASD